MGVCGGILTLMRENAPQREHSLREVFNGLRWIIRTGAQWRMMPNDLPPWYTVQQQSQRWLAAGVFEQMVNDLRRIVRLAEGHAAELRVRKSIVSPLIKLSKLLPGQPAENFLVLREVINLRSLSAVIFDSRTLQSTPESGQGAGFDGAKKRRGRKVHIAVDTLGHLLAAYVTAANEQDRAQVAELAEQVQAATSGTVQVAFVDQGYTGEQAAADAAAQGIRLEVIKLPDAKHGFILLPRRWVVERSIAWLARFRRLARDYERLPQTLAGFHFLAFACLLLSRLLPLFQLQAW